MNQKTLIVRDFTKILASRLAEKEPLIQVILGPRQVGKTTAVTQQLRQKGIHYASGDDSVALSADWIREQWVLAEQRHGRSAVLVLDEIQKVEGWSNEVKRLWDQSIRNRSRVKVVLLGSSSLDLETGIHESLTGRFERIDAHHWSWAEMNKAFGISFEEFLRNGGYPGYAKFRKDQKRWADYLNRSIIDTVVDRDILKFKSVKSPALFRQCFDLIRSFSGQVISYQKLLGQLQEKGNVDLVKRYLTLFESAFLIRCVPKWSGSTVRTIGSSPKILMLAPAFIQELDESNIGRRFESAVGAVLHRTRLPLYYWTDGSFELDYIVRLSSGRPIGIEVKSGRKRHSKSISEFSKKNPKVDVNILSVDQFGAFENDPVVWLSR
jgi:predicted AAA+ superfamily ATPase